MLLKGAGEDGYFLGSCEGRGVLRLWLGGVRVDATIKTLSVPQQPVGLHHTKERENSAQQKCVLTEGGGGQTTK